MNSYGDSQSARARARVPGSVPKSAPDDEQSGRRHAEKSRTAPDAYRRGVGGTAPPGAASARPASLGGTSGRVPVGAAAPAGRATVGSARVAARPAVEPGSSTRGRAAVRPAGYEPGSGAIHSAVASPI